MQEENINVNNEEVQQEPQVKEEKTYTQSEVDEMFTKRVGREKAKLEKEFEARLNALEESAKLSQMSEQERQEHEYNKRIQELEAREKALQEKESAYSKQQYHNEITKQLQAKGLPTDLADLLINLSAEEVANKISSMEQSFGNSMNTQIQERLKQSTIPQESTKEMKPQLTLSEVNNMSTKDFMNNKKEIEQLILNSFKK